MLYGCSAGAQVGDGNSDFTPNPEESRKIVRAGYNPTLTPTLMVQFTNDSFDQTPEMLDILQACSGGQGLSALLDSSCYGAPACLLQLHAVNLIKEQIIYIKRAAFVR